LITAAYCATKKKKKKKKKTPRFSSALAARLILRRHLHVNDITLHELQHYQV